MIYVLKRWRRVNISGGRGGGVIPGSRVFFFFGGGGERLSKSRVQGPESRVQSPDSKVQGPVQLLGYAMISITISGIPK